MDYLETHIDVYNQSWISANKANFTKREYHFGEIRSFRVIRVELILSGRSEIYGF